MKRASWIAIVIALIALPVVLASHGDDQAAGAESWNRTLPKGTYTAIVFTATGVADGTAAVGVLKIGRDQFVVNIAPGSTISIPFGNGWVLQQDAEITLRAGAGTLG